MKLYFSRNPNPRLALAVARYLNAPVQFEFAAPFAPGQAERFSKLNPNLSIPILEENGRGLWETDAIACRLSRVVRSSFWRTGDEEPDMIRWLSWGKASFVQAGDMVHFERGTKHSHDHGLPPLESHQWHGVHDRAGAQRLDHAAPCSRCSVRKADYLKIAKVGHNEGFGESVALIDPKGYLAANCAIQFPVHSRTWQVKIRFSGN